MRKDARESALKLIYANIFNGENSDLTFEAVSVSLDEADKAYLKSIIGFIDVYSEFIKFIVTKYLRKFTLDRLPKIDAAVLTLAVCEIFYMKDIPMEVSVNEAVELAKKYSTEKSSKFINGLLASVLKDKETLKDEFENNRREGIIAEDQSES